MSEINPVTANQMFLARMAGMDVKTPTPVTADQMFMQKIIDNGSTGGGGGVTSLEELLATEILPECSPVYDENEGAFVITEVLPFVEGEKYTVNWNGVEYSATAVSAEGMTMVTNDGANINTGEGAVFVIISIPESGATLFAPFDGSTTLTVSIKTCIIPTKYLPQNIGAYHLYGATGGINYLYNSSDTSNEANRTTMAQLRSMAQSGRAVWFTAVTDITEVYVPAHISINTELGYGAVQIGIPGYSATNASYYTAEYTGQT